MEDSGAILCQISSFKDMLDQVNEDIEQNIQRTREIESKIVNCSEIEKGYHMRESELTKMVFIGELELNGLIQVAASARTSLQLMEEELGFLKLYLDETTKRISEKRQKFIALCSQFQSDIVKGENEELCVLLSEKEYLENEKSNLTMKINALRNSTKEFIEEILDEIHSSCSVIEIQVQRGSLENKKLLNDIDELKLLLCSLSSHEDYARPRGQSCPALHRKPLSPARPRPSAASDRVYIPPHIARQKSPA